MCGEDSNLQPALDTIRPIRRQESAKIKFRTFIRPKIRHFRITQNLRFPKLCWYGELTLKLRDEHLAKLEVSFTFGDRPQPVG